MHLVHKKQKQILKPNIIRKGLSIILSAAMIVGSISIGGIGVKEVKADEGGAQGTKYSFDASTDSATGSLEDNTELTDGTKIGTDNFFSVNNGDGGKTWRVRIYNGDKAIESKSGKSYIKFEAKKKAVVTYTIGSNKPDTNNSGAVLKDSSGEEVSSSDVYAYDENKYTKSVTVEKGIYTLAGKKATSGSGTAKDNFFLYSISVQYVDAGDNVDLDNPKVSIVPGDKQLTVSWNKVENADRYQLTVSAEGIAISGYDNKEITESKDSYSEVVKGLTNGVEYTCTVTAVRNEDGATADGTVKGTPVEIGSGYVYDDIDLSNGLAVGTKYGNPAVATVEILDKDGMPYDATKGTTIDGVTYGGAIQGKNNPTQSGNIATAGAAFKITAMRDAKITFVTKSASGKTWFFATNTEVIDTGNGVTQGRHEFEVKAGNEYYYYAKGSKLTVCAITTTAGIPEVNWDSIDAPAVTTKLNDENTGKIDINYTANINSAVGQVAGEYLEVEVYKGSSATGEPVKTLISRAAGTSGTLTYGPDATGTYTFKPVLKRTGYADKAGQTSTFNFTLPLAAPNVTATSKGGGIVKVSWDAVPEADSYEVFVDGESKGTTTELSMNVKGLTVGQTYTFTVKARRGSEESDLSEAKTETVTASAKIEWKYQVFGNGADEAKATLDESKNIDLGNDTESEVRLVAGKKNGNQGVDDTFTDSSCGKLQSTGPDGLAYYYTTVPVGTNFTLTATAHVNKWKYTNGQEGFGLMAADRIYTTSTGSEWYNSYMAYVGKVEYYYDTTAGKVSDAGDKISMKLGIGAQEKLGVTKANEENFAVATDLRYSMTTLETSCANRGAGTYNVVGNLQNPSNDIKDASTMTTDITLTIQKNNTGYFITYMGKDGAVTKKFYEPDALNKQDEENVYIGFFVSRFADVTFKNVSFTTIAAEDDAPAEERPIEYVTPNCSVISSTSANSSSYNFTYLANADGKLTVKDSENNILVNNQTITNNVRFEQKFSIEQGDNKYYITFVPDENFRPDGSEYKRLTSYEPIESTLTVTYNIYSGEDNKLYVSPTGTSVGAGTKSSPLDIYTAVKSARPGQTIVLAGGRYQLSSTVTVPRGIDGTSTAKISMIADPYANARPVFDFGGMCAGMIFAGNYWYCKGFDVTNSANGQKGIQISGSYSTFEDINTYYNGNTGMQVSRYLGSDEFAQWPSYDTILNCSSYCNADAGYEDADGFAAKLTVGNGIVFDGCISHHNADDGWDLFAKVATGSIGAVTIKNSVAYANGYWINKQGEVINAGNGNGFKMGGDSLPGSHMLINSVSYDNKAKGIDSNSCPDIKVMNCTSYNNGSYNVALYTNSAKNTNFEVTGLASFRKGTNVAEQFKLLGTQDESKVKKSVNYYWDTASQKSVNTEGDECTEDWFVSTDTTITPTRFSDGSINMNGLLVLTAKAKQGAQITPIGKTDPVKPSTPSGGSSDSSDSDDSDSDDTTTGSGIGSGSSDSASTTINDKEFASNDGISNSTAGVIASVKEDGTVADNTKIAENNEAVTSEISNKIKNTTEKEIVIYARENTEVTAAAMKELAESGKKLSIGVVNNDGKLTAVVTIDGSKLKGEMVDFKLQVTVGTDAGDNSKSIQNIVKSQGISIDSMDIVDFEYSGSLPGTFKTAVNVSDKYANGAKLALFYYNTATNQLENQYQLVTVENGYAEFEFSHCSSYVLIEQSALNTMITTSAMSPKTADSSRLITLLLLMGFAVMVLFGVGAAKKRD